MPFGRLTPMQLACVRRHVAGETVTDLGAGDLGYAHELLRLGASGIVAVDKEPMFTDERRIRPVVSLFADFYQETKVAWLAWPQNNLLPGLVPILCGVEKVLYLGKNTGGSACGNAALFRHLAERELLDYVPDRANVLAVYGRRLAKGVTRDMHEEELAGLRMAFELYPYTEL